jgi:hypothetical protein
MEHNSDMEEVKLAPSDNKLTEEPLQSIVVTSKVKPIDTSAMTPADLVQLINALKSRETG